MSDTSVQDVVCEAIREMKCLSFIYHDNERVVEPHTLGVNLQDRDVLVGYQVGGFTQSPGPEYWRTFTLSDITRLSKLDQSFYGPRSGYNPRDPRFRIVYCQL